jgi:hypothetical protein
VLLFAALWLLRVLRLLLAGILGRSVLRRPAAREADVARDPVCGAWFDRRFAVTGRRGAATVEVCSDACRRKLEAT